MRRVHSRISPRSVFDQAFCPAPGVSTAPAGDSGLILRAPSGQCVSLNCQASRVWALLERGTSLRTVQSLLWQEYGTPSAWLENELPSLLQVLVGRGFLERTA